MLNNSKGFFIVSISHTYQVILVFISKFYCNSYEQIVTTKEKIALENLGMRNQIFANIIDLESVSEETVPAQKHKYVKAPPSHVCVCCVCVFCSRPTSQALVLGLYRETYFMYSVYFRRILR